MDRATLPNDPEALKAIIFDQKERYESRIEYLEERVRFLIKEIFGRSSEKRSTQDDPKQLHLFDEAETLVEEEKTQPVAVPGYARQKPKRKPLPAYLPRVEVIHDIDEKEKVCECGEPLSRIGEQVCEKLDIIPAKIQVIRHIRYKYACKGCEGVESESPTVKTAQLPPQLIPKGMATAGLVAHIATAKYVDALPLYRQEKIFARHGIEISRSTMASWMVMAANSCTVLMSLLQRELLSGPLINADETPVQVFNEPGRANTTKSYMWVFRGGPPGKEVVLYRYSPTRSSEVPREILAGYRGYLQTDAFSAYGQFEEKVPDIVLVGCFAHVRRYFVKVIDARPKGTKKTGSAEVALNYIRKLYEIEKTARHLPPDEIRMLRKEQSEPILYEFKAWMDERVRRTPPKGLLGKAFSYTLSHWKKLIRYLEDGHITPDNNMAENAIRPFVVGRKNWLFSGHPNGANAAAALYSLIETAKSCGLEPYQYLCYIFEKIPYARSEEDYAMLLPQKLTPEQLNS
jgi:transposase